MFSDFENSVMVSAKPIDSVIPRFYVSELGS